MFEQQNSGGMSETVTLTLEDARDLAVSVLQHNGFSAEHAMAIARTVCRAQQDDCHSHGLYRLLDCVRVLQAGKVSADARPEVSHPSGAIVRVDAKGAYAPLAVETGLPLLLRRVRTLGLSALVVTCGCHAFALWPEVEDLAREGVAALYMMPNYSFVAPAGGTSPVLGTNPVAFAWPRPGSVPYVFDLAASEAARGEIELHRRAGRRLPPGWALDRRGEPTTDPAEAMSGAMLPFGGHKGSALATMVELLAGSLIGDVTSLQAQETDPEPIYRHGMLLLAFDPALFGGGRDQQSVHGAEALFAAITAQGARLPSQRRFAARERNAARGTVTIPRHLHEDLLTLLPPVA